MVRSLAIITARAQNTIRKPLLLNIAAALGLALAGANEASADDPARGRCCRSSVEDIRYCCITCCERINQCATNEACRQADE